MTQVRPGVKGKQGEGGNISQETLVGRLVLSAESREEMTHSPGIIRANMTLLEFSSYGGLD